MTKEVTCSKCKKKHYASFAECPFCAVTEGQVNISTHDPGLTANDRGTEFDLSATGESDSLAAGSGSHKYDLPGTTDWTGEGRPDWEKREGQPPAEEKTPDTKPGV